MEKKVRKTRSGTRSSEERIEALELKQKFHQDCIEKLEVLKQAILNPKARVKMSNHDKELLDAIKKSGKSIEEVIKMLGD